MHKLATLCNQSQVEKSALDYGPHTQILQKPCLGHLNLKNHSTMPRYLNLWHQWHAQYIKASMHNSTKQPEMSYFDFSCIVRVIPWFVLRSPPRLTNQNVYFKAPIVPQAETLKPWLCHGNTGSQLSRKLFKSVAGCWLSGLGLEWRCVESFHDPCMAIKCI